MSVLRSLFVCLLAGVLCTSSFLFAQSERGTISGTVRDWVQLF